MAATILTNKITDIKNTILGGNLSNRYRIYLDIPVNDLSMTTPLAQQNKADSSNFSSSFDILCQSSSVPDRKIGGYKEVFFRGRKTLMRTIQEYTHEWTVNVVDTRTFSVRNRLEMWLQGIDDQDSDNIWKKYKTDAKVVQLQTNFDGTNDIEYPIFGYKLIDLYLTSIGNYEMSDAEAAIVKFDVTFAYSKCVPISKEEILRM
jgi:hypothetical protein